jgi:hypothetical protein
MQQAANTWQPGMAFPSDWPLTLPVRSWQQQHLTSDYTIKVVLGDYNLMAGIPLGQEMDAFDQWSMAAVDFSRQRGYAKPVRTATQLGTDECIERFMGYCFKHEAVPAGQLSFGLLERPQLVASYVSFLTKRGVNADTIQNSIARLRKALTFRQSTSQVGVVCVATRKLS